MITARTQQNTSEKSKANSSRSSMFIAPTQLKKNNENSAENKEVDLFITPTRQQSAKETTTTENTAIAENVSQTVSTRSTTTENLEEKKEEKVETQAQETKKEEAQKSPIVAKETSTTDVTATAEAKVAGETKTTPKGKTKGTSGGGKAYNIPDASKVGVVEKEIVKEEDAPLALPTENSKVYADGLASQTPTNFIRGVKESNTAVAEVQANEQKTLRESLPEIEQPTGIPTKTAVQKQKAKAPSDKAGEQIKGDKSILPDLSPKGKKEGAQIPTKSVQPPSSVLARIRSFFGFGKSGSEEDRKSQIKSGIRKLPTSESVTTSPGTKPKVDLTGQADPNKNKQNLDESTQTTNKEQAKNLAESKLYKGEDDIYPEMELEMMSPTVELSAPPETTALSEEIPTVSAEIKSSFDTQAKGYIDKELAPDMQKQNEEYAKMQADQEKEHKKSEDAIDTETQRVKKEQEQAQNTAKSEVEAQRGEWQKENENVKKEYGEKSDAEKKKIDGQIDEKVKDADTKITKEYSTAKKEADKEVAKTDREAARKKAQAKKDSEKKSWWDRAIDAVSSFFDALKAGLNKLFDGLRKLVKGLIEAAKKFANKLIDLARDAIVGMIKVFGEALKALVNVALAAFPKLRDKFNAAIDKAVNLAVEAVNVLAEGLKKAVNALLDLLGAALDAILALYQAFYNLLLDAMKFLTTGLIKIIRFLWNLQLGALYAPGQFFGALAEVALGGNPAEPLKDFEVPIGQEDNWTAAMGKKAGGQTTDATSTTTAIPDHLQSVLTKSKLGDNDVTLEPYPAVTLDPELIADLPQMQEGVPLELGGAGADAITTEQFQASAADAAGYALPPQVEQSVDERTGTASESMEEAAEKPNPDWITMSNSEKLDHYNNKMLVESENVGNTDPQPGKVASTPNMDNSPAVLITKTGRLDVATRLAFMGRQMMTGLQVFWNKNKVWIIAALVTALIAAGLIAFFTGGAGLVAAVDIIVKAMIIIFGAYAVYQAMGHIWDYVKKAWAGDAVGAGKSLALAMAVIVMEFLLDKILLGMGKVFKRIVAAAKTTRIGQKLVKGANFIRKGTTRVGNIVRKGAAKIKGTRLVVYMRGVVGKGTKKLSNLRQKILDKFKFRRIWLEKSGRWLELWGEFNAKVILVKERTDEHGNTTVSHADVGTGSPTGIKPRNSTTGDRTIIGNRPKGTRKQVVVSDSYDEFLKKLKIDDPPAYKLEIEKLNDALKTNKTKAELADIVKSRRSATSVHSKKLGDNMVAGGKTRPPNTAAHHMVASTDPRAALSRSILKSEGIDFNDAINGVFLKTSKKHAAPPAIPHSVVHTGPYFAEVERRLLAAQAKGPGNLPAALRKIEADLLSGTFKYK
ncbi:AHH domain-containing protein [Kordia sp.]|uniref:AHH domain-containing protein n=1 Tax=Kordia sp. TaxID=1965332 RepID=UPI003D27B3F2